MAEARAEVRKYILQEHNAVLATVDCTQIFAAWQEHVRRWELEVDGLGEIMMHQALAGAALQLSLRDPQEVTAWTVNFSQPPTNVFVTGGGEDRTLTGRYYREGVEDTGFNRLFVQRSHPRNELQRSMLEVEGLDLLGIFEQFYRKSEQQPARFVEHGPTEFSVVLGLPEADPAWIESLDPAQVAAMCPGPGDGPTDTFTLRFGCGCNPQRVAEIMARMFARQADEFFQGQPMVEAVCPRCGARHLLDRESFDRAAEGIEPPPAC